MATIIPFLKDGGVFDPKDVQAMSKALDDVCESLKLGAGPAREVVAERIIDLARHGFRSPTMLRNRVIYEVGQVGRLGNDGRDNDGRGQTA